MYLFYTTVLRLWLLAILPFYLVRFKRYAPTLRDRFGYLKLPPLRDAIWVHAVSVGEVKAVERLIEKMRTEWPDRPIVLSTATPTGQQLARERNDIVAQAFYFPLDTPAATNRALERVRPCLVIIAETEIWPNFLRECRRRGIPVMMINGRISDRSYPRYLKVRRWLARVLDDYAVLGVQSETDRKRIESLGADPGRVRVFGNLKYDSDPARKTLDPVLASFLKGWNPLWIAASTMPGEDSLVLDAFAQLRASNPGLKLLIAPRHPERFNEVYELVRSRGLACTRRARLDGNGDVLLLDSIGELAAAFEFATVVFMGGTLAPYGGHNILEPARYSKPIVFGPHMENFRDIARQFIEADAAVQIHSADDLASATARLLSDSDAARELGARARQAADANAGATDRVLDYIRVSVLPEPAGALK